MLLVGGVVLGRVVAVCQWRCFGGGIERRSAAGRFAVRHDCPDVEFLFQIYVGIKQSENLYHNFAYSTIKYGY